VLIGLPSDGVHSNGFSLVRRIIREQGLDLGANHGLPAPLGEVLLRPTRLYGPQVQGVLGRGVVHGISHITGGGISGNVPRMLPEGLCARLDTASWEVPPELQLLVEAGKLSRSDAYSVFNMGLGLVLAVEAKAADRVLEAIQAAGGSPRVVGEVIEGEGVQL
jgi:phosphoribosylformylglycinamidine cyclo-ligase